MSQSIKQTPDVTTKRTQYSSSGFETDERKITATGKYKFEEKEDPENEDYEDDFEDVSVYPK